MSRELLRLTVFENKWIPHDPTPHQAAFLCLPCREACYGGAAGGGKSDALLMAALQFVDVPGYNALLLRRTYAELNLPEGLMTRAHQWLANTAAQWDSDGHKYTFPSGATLTFGYADTERDIYRYQGAAFQFVGWDELTQFPLAWYLYISFSRMRRLAGVPIPIRTRSATNPGGMGHQWVYDRLIMGSATRRDRIFIPARLGDNPHLDRADYIASLQELDPITRQQLLEGLWVLDTATKPWLREWFAGRNRYNPRDVVHANTAVARFISWDTALKDTSGSAYSVGIVGDLLADYRLAIREVYRERMSFPLLVSRIEWQAERYRRFGNLRNVVIEDKASGTSAVQVLKDSGPPWLAPLVVPFPVDGSKDQRDQLAGVWGRLGCILLPEPDPSVPWLYDFESEIFSVPNTEYRDQADALSQLVDFCRNLLATGYHAREPYGIAA